ncbi:MAG: DUF3352 domain-containing protein [Pyrinomonadaceae bacterium]
MNICKTGSTVARLLLTLALIVTPLSAQRRRTPPPKAQPPAPATPAADPTFDNLLAADSYKIYGEVRGVGQLLRSGGVNDILDPIMKLTAPPKEFKTLVKWATSQADALMTSRLMFAAWPSRPKLPQALFVIEFPSAEEARKFEPQLKEFLPRFLPTPTPESSPGPSDGKKESLEPQPKATPAPPPPFILKQTGSLVFVAATPFTLKNLRPNGSKLLAEDQNFRQVHDRFSAESVFLYFDVASIEKEDQERMRQMEEDEKKRLESEAANPKKSDEEDRVEADDPPPPVAVTPEGPAPEPVVISEPQRGTGATLKNSQDSQATVDVSTGGVVLQGETRDSPTSFPSLALLSGSLFAGRPKWPEAFGVGITFDAETYVVRALLLNSPGVKGAAIPLIPHLVSGPALSPEAASIMPADTEIFASVSLDYPMIYEGLLKAMKSENEVMRRGMRQNVKDHQPESPFAAYEAKLGIKVKDDLLPLLGNEIAIGIPAKALGISAPQPAPAPSSGEPGDDKSAQKDAPPEPQPVMAIAVRDKEAVRILLPKIIDSYGFKGASMLATSEKRDDTELISYLNVVSYAFIGNFLVVSPDVKAVRHVVDSYLNQQTLGSDSNFKNYTRWQPRQVQGQVYISPSLMEGYTELSKQANATANNKLSDFLARLNPTPEPVTYALSNEGLGPLHELHIPKNLIMLMIAGIAGEVNQPPLARNEAIAQSALRMLVSAQATYQSTTGNGNYGTLDQLLEQGLVHKDLLQNYGYKIEVTVVGAKFEVTAVPNEYEKTGRMSFFVDESGVLRGGDRGGSAATVADKPVQ